MRNLVPNSTWYRPPSANARMPQGYVEAREYDYRGWWEEKFGKLWRDRVEVEIPASDSVRKTILKPVKVVHEEGGYAVTIRTVTPAVYCDRGTQIAGEEVKCKTAAPALYVVSVGGQRIDSFLKFSNAKALADSLVSQIWGKK